MINISKENILSSAQGQRNNIWERLKILIVYAKEPLLIAWINDCFTQLPISNDKRTVSQYCQ